MTTALEDRGVLTPRETARYMRVNKGVVYQLLHAGVLPARRDANGYWLIRRAECDRYLEGQEREYQESIP